MLPRHLYVAVLALLLQPITQAVAADQGSPDYLSDNPLKNPKKKTQDVLEHKPATAPSCEQFVRAAQRL